MVNKYNRHKFTEVTRQYDVSDLTQSILKEGQLVPALLWWDGTEWLLIDGWHRQLACNKLGIALTSIKLPKDTVEWTLPKKILDIQLNNKMAGAVQSRCEAVIYLEMVKEFASAEKMTQKTLCSVYDKLSYKEVSRLKKLKSIKPEWFTELRTGRKVNVGTEENPVYSDSPYRLLTEAENLLRVTEDVKVPELDYEELLERTAKFTARVAPLLRQWEEEEGVLVMNNFYRNRLEVNYGRE